jgi:PAS domain S-box-containing protein
MKDQDKTKNQLISELAALRQRISDLQERLRLSQTSETAQQDAEAQLQRRVQEMTLFGQITTLTASSKNTVEALHNVCVELARFLQAPQAGFAILNPEHTEAKVIADYHPPDSPSAIGVVIPVRGNPSMTYILEHKVPLVITEAQTDPLLSPVHDVMRQRNVQSILLAPILVEGKVVGTLGFDAFQRRVFSQTDVGLVQHVANQAGPLLMWKQAEEALRESEERYRTTIDAMDDAIHVVDRDLRFILFNEALHKLAVESGVEGDPTGEQIFEYFPFLSDEIRAEYEQVLTSGEPLVTEETTTIGQRTMWTETRKIPTLNEDGKIYRVITIIRDVTERKRVEQALRLTQFSTDRAGDAAFWMDPEANLFYVNDAACRSLGYSREELLSMTIHDIDPDFPKERWLEYWKEVKRRNSFTLESHHRTKSGRVFPVEVTVNYLEFGGKEYNCAFVRDITHRKRAEQTLQQLNRHLFLLNQVGQELVATLDQFLITEQLLQVVTEIVDAEGASVWLWEEEQTPQLHTGALQPHGGPLQDWLVCRAASPHAQGGSPLNLRVRPDQGVVGWVVQHGESVIVSSVSDDARFFSGIDAQTGFDTRSLLAVPLRVRDKIIGVLEAVNKRQGDLVPAQGDLVPAQGDFDEKDMILLEILAASAAVAIDNANLIQALKQRTVELQARNEDLDAYAHTVAHDLKGPLAYMIGFAQVLEEEHASLPAEELPRYLHTVSRSGHKMNNIINELLLMARLREAEVELTPLDIAGIVDQVLERLVYMIEERQAQIVLPETWPVVLGYGPWVEEVWVNYIDNALKYGGQPPRIELGFDRVDSGEWGVDSDHAPLTTDHYPLIRFWVRDNGPGLTPQEQGRLFRSFEQLDRVRAKGHGLGLSIVRRIVEKLGGTVGVESEVGQGSVFWFTMRGGEE